MELDTKHFKDLLEKEKETLLSELSTVGRKNPENPKDWEATEPDMGNTGADENEVADSMEEFGTNKAILDQLETRLWEVNSALKKIEDGTYGICEVSGEPIELDRLEANPAARTNKAHMND